MKTAFLVFLALSSVSAEQAQSNPLGKVFELMDALEAKVKSEGEAEGKAFKEFFEWCDESAQNLNNEIKTSKKSQEKLTAKIDELSADIEVSESKIEDLAAAISSNENELSQATAIREKEAADFAASEKELMATVDTLDRAVGIISSEMSKNPAALAQLDASSMSSLVQSLNVVVDAAGFSGSDSKRLTALIQSQQEEDEMGAPAPSSYKSQSGGIVDVLEDLKDKAETELAEARKAESTTKHNYEMMKQSLEDQVTADTKTMGEEKSGKEQAGEEKATAEGDLSVTVEALKESEAALATANSDCMTTAADHEATVAARDEELKVIATAEKILKESTGGAEGQTYSLLQMATASKMTTRADLANSEVLNVVKKLARDQHSAALAQLASRIAVVVRFGSKSKHGEDPFAKIKGLISDMIVKLEQEAEAEATEKAYCDEEMAKTEAKKAELDDDIAKLTSKIDKAASRSASLKEEVVGLEAELATIAKTQAEMDKIRGDQNAAYTKAKSELTQGLEGVRKALEVLRSYYGSAAAMLQESDDPDMKSFMQQPAPPEQHEKSSGAGGSIIGILEVCESDFATNLAKEETEEADSAANYEKVTQENKVATATKSQDAKYKTKEAASLDKQISELSSDKDTSSTELGAVMEYYGKIKERCVAKPETYEERKARREAEIGGLKEALSILENEAAFLQRSRKHKKAHLARFMGA